MKKIFLLLPLLFLACSSSSDKSGAEQTEDRLVGETFNVNGLEEITAIVAECDDGGDGTLDAAVEQSTISFNFLTVRSYSFTVDGDDAIGSWEAIDNDTIEMDTENDQILEVDYSIDSSIDTLSLTLTQNWIDLNCTAAN